MIRWRFVITRLVVIVAIVWLITMGLGPIARYVTVTGLETTIGARVDIGQAHVGLTPPRIVYDDVTLGDPRDGKSMQNAASADRIELEIDGTELLHRRWVIRRGRIDGLRIGSRRQDSGQFEAVAVDELDDDSEQGPSMLVKMLAGAGDAVSAEAEAKLDSLQTRREGERIVADWKNRYRDAIVRGRQLETKIEDDLQKVRGIDNPLRDWQTLQQVLADGQNTRRSMGELLADIKTAPQWVAQDRAALKAAKRADLESIDAFVPGNLADAESIGIDLVAGGIRDQIADIRRLLDGTRDLADYTVLGPETDDRTRGTNHDFAATARPQFLIRQCGVSGLFRKGGEVYQMDGTIENVTPTPELLQQPTSVRLRLDGPHVIRAHYVADRRGDVPTDRVVMHWPSMPSDTVQLGKSDSVGIRVDGGDRELWVSVVTRGDHIEGHLRSRQTGVQMALETGDDVGETAAAQSLASSLAKIDTVDIDARFAGQWRDLDLDLNTNLGGALKGAIQGAVSDQMIASRQVLAGKVEQAYLQQTMKLNELEQRFQSEIAQLETKADEALASIKGKVINEVGGDAYIGRLRGLIR